MSVGFTVSKKMRPLDALDPTRDRVRSLLFTPFDATVWINFGVIIFLGRLFNITGMGLGLPSRSLPKVKTLHDAQTWFYENMATVVLIGLVALLVSLVVGTALAWLRSRGQLMLVRAVAYSDHRIESNWKETGGLTNSLFFFRVALLLSGMANGLIFGVATVGIVAYVYRNVTHDPALLFLAAAPTSLIWLTVQFTISGASALLSDFVVPLMVRNQSSCIQAWRVFGGLVTGNMWALQIFYLVRFCILLIIAFTGFLVGCFTCSLGFLPVIHHAALSPLYLFDRVYSLSVLEQLGPEYTIKPRPPELPVRA